ncbi:MAG TPA: sulfurtransferase [Lutibacter sp.]|nr:sulfurtransferase [Lutibacter sp.]
MGPLYPQELLSSEYNLLIGFLIGIGFGFILEAAGFTSTRKLAGVFYGYDATVIKVFFTAALTALVGLFILHFMGWIDITATFFPKTYWIPTLIGGAIMGAGFIIGGFCPGTSVAAAATGKIDAMVFVVGVIIGIFGFIFTFDLWEGIRKAGNMGVVNVTEWLGINEGVFIFIFIVIAAITFVVFQRWQDYWKEKMSKEDIDELGI